LSFFDEHFGVHSSSEDHQKLSSFAHQFLTNCCFQPNVNFTDKLLIPANHILSFALSFDNSLVVGVHWDVLG
jgi:hypothetical protein